MDMDKIYKAFKETILECDNHLIDSSIEDEEYKDICQLLDIKNGEYRIGYRMRTEPIDEIMCHVMTTIKQIFVVINYDEDFNSNNEIIKRQIAICLITEWDEGYFPFHYFINEIEDFNVNKFENELNKYCENLKYNNYNIIQNEVRKIFNTIINKVSKI